MNYNNRELFTREESLFLFGASTHDLWRKKLITHFKNCLCYGSFFRRIVLRSKTETYRNKKYEERSKKFHKKHLISLFEVSGKKQKKHWCGLCTFLGWISASNTIGGMWISKFAIGGSLDDKGTKNLGIWLSSYLARFQSKPWRPRRRSTLLYTTTRLRGANIQVYMGMTNRPAIWLAQILAHVEINFPCEWIADDDQEFRPVIARPASTHNTKH